MTLTIYCQTLQGEKKLSTPLHWYYREVIDIAAAQINSDHHIQVYVRRNRCERNDECYGEVLWPARDGVIPVVNIYTKRRWYTKNGYTIAHEFGHLKHLIELPGSEHWPELRQESYANYFARMVMSTLALKAYAVDEARKAAG